MHVRSRLNSGVRLLQTPMRIRLLVPLLLVPLFAAGCFGPREKDVRADFLRANPGALIEMATPGEGDGAAVYYHIRYRVPGDTILREVEWQYMKNTDGEWHNTWRDSAQPVVTRKGDR